MDPVVEAAVASWNLDPWVVVPLALGLALYLNGWRRLHRHIPRRFPVWRLASFSLGVLALFVAVASPLDSFGSLLLQAHMLQHLLMMMVAPLLMLLGAPVLPLLRGLPRRVAREWIGPFMASPGLRRFGHGLTHPVVCWVLFVSTTVAWHTPALYELALHSKGWHELEHACFFTTALLFWWPVVQPWPSRRHWPRWAMIPYLVLADIQNTMLSAILVFADRAIYPTYASAPRILGDSALADQAAAGALMWVPGSLVYLIPAGWLALEALGVGRGVRPSSRLAQHSTGAAGIRKKYAHVQTGPSTVARARRGWDLLAAPVLGTVLGWRHLRKTLQLVMFGLALAIVLDGFIGPQTGPMNLAGVLPWTHWRGFAVIALLVFGNLFCMACPFMLPRSTARRFLSPRRQWPRALRSKWLAVGLVAVYLWAYEAFGLWNSPWWTAWIIVGYFAAALLVDSFFEGASFCKYVCPIGQFHFVSSLASPIEVKVRDVEVCRSCTGHECIRGDAHRNGCELKLFLPRKSGNMDCTFCLDCVHACSHDNIGLLATLPASDLVSIRPRSSIGRYARRSDIAALVLVIVFGAFANAAAMVEPVVGFQRHVAGALGDSSGLIAYSSLFVASVFLMPLLVVATCGAVGRSVSGIRASWRVVTRDFVMALAPLGFSMWLAHFSFHLATGWSTALPVVQRFVASIGIHGLGPPRWTLSCCGPVGSWVVPLEILMLDAGVLLTLYVAWRIAQRWTRGVRQAALLLAPWVVVSVALYTAGIWIVLQPMQMRGMLLP